MIRDAKRRVGEAGGWTEANRFCDLGKAVEACSDECPNRKPANRQRSAAIGKVKPNRDRSRAASSRAESEGVRAKVASEPTARAHGLYAVQARLKARLSWLQFGVS
jgi:hypothetical protein